MFKCLVLKRLPTPRLPSPRIPPEPSNHSQPPVRTEPQTRPEPRIRPEPQLRSAPRPVQDNRRNGIVLPDARTIPAAASRLPRPTRTTSSEPPALAPVPVTRSVCPRLEAHLPTARPCLTPQQRVQVIARRRPTHRPSDANVSNPPPAYEIYDPNPFFKGTLQTPPAAGGQVFERPSRFWNGSRRQGATARLGEGMRKCTESAGRAVKDAPQSMREARRERKIRQAKQKMAWLEEHDFLSQ
jgi:hypothetical protein